MKILIIGSKGFIGSYCVSYFLKKHDVWQCDVVVDYTTEQYVQVDATNADFTELMQLQKFDICINCSGAASVPDSIKNPQRDFILNTVNVFKQLDAIRKHNSGCRYVNLSSAAVYGNPKSLPIKEDDALNPISPYGIHKKMAEDICKEFFEVYNVATCSLRLFSAYGINLKKQLFWDLHKKAKNNNIVSLFGTGEETRDFIFIKDLVQVIELVIEKGTFNNEILNVASGKEVKISDAVSLFYKHYNSKVEFRFGQNIRTGDPINWKADITKLTRLGFKPKYKLEDGLIEYTQWIKGLD